MKKYIVFGYDNYYPVGGLNDIAGSFDTLEEAKICAMKNTSDTKEIVDRDTWEIIN